MLQRITSIIKAKIVPNGGIIKLTSVRRRKSAEHLCSLPARVQTCPRHPSPCEDGSATPISPRCLYRNPRAVQHVRAPRQSLSSRQWLNHRLSSLVENVLVKEETDLKPASPLSRPHPLAFMGVPKLYYNPGLFGGDSQFADPNFKPTLTSTVKDLHRLHVHWPKYAGVAAQTAQTQHTADVDIEMVDAPAAELDIPILSDCDVAEGQQQQIHYDDAMEGVLNKINGMSEVDPLKSSSMTVADDDGHDDGHDLSSLESGTCGWRFLMHNERRYAAHLKCVDKRWHPYRRQAPKPVTELLSRKALAAIFKLAEQLPSPVPRAAMDTIEDIYSKTLTKKVVHWDPNPQVVFFDPNPLEIEADLDEVSTEVFEQPVPKTTQPHTTEAERSEDSKNGEHLELAGSSSMLDTPSSLPEEKEESHAPLSEPVIEPARTKKRALEDSFLEDDVEHQPEVKSRSRKLRLPRCRASTGQDNGRRISGPAETTKKSPQLISLVPDQFRDHIQAVNDMWYDQKSEDEATRKSGKGFEPKWWNEVQSSEFEDKFVIKSVTQYSSNPVELKIRQPSGHVEIVPVEVLTGSVFKCPDPSKPEIRYNTRASCRLTRERNMQELGCFSAIREEHPEVWEAIIGTMLQEGVTLDNILMCHRNADTVLQHQDWEQDHLRLDQLWWHKTRNLPVPSDFSEEFHVVPSKKAQIFNATLDHIKRSPEICYLLRTLVSEWLNHEKNHEVFRRIARKAGWVPSTQYQFQKDFVRWFVKEAPQKIREGCEAVYSTRFPRFYKSILKRIEEDAELEGDDDLLLLPTTEWVKAQM